MKFNDITRAEYLNIGGIYILKSKLDSRVYVGSAKSFYNRLQSHKESLIGQYSGCTKLNNFVSKHGLSSIDIELIPTSGTRDELFEIEKQYILFYNAVDNGLNCSYETKVPNVPFTEERRKKIGDKSKNRIFSKDSRKKMSENCKWRNCKDKHPNAKLKNEDVVNIKKMIILGYRICDISRLYKISYNAIYNIKSNNKWSSIVVNNKDISEVDVDNYKEMSKQLLDNVVRKGGGLTLNNVSEIKRMIDNGDNQQDILLKFKISPQCFNSIKSGRNYSYVK
jgi:hypothetical protein